jgi:tetratricopeptide (TPR) repeat protein
MGIKATAHFALKQEAEGAKAFSSAMGLAAGDVNQIHALIAGTRDALPAPQLATLASEWVDRDRSGWTALLVSQVCTEKGAFEEATDILETARRRVPADEPNQPRLLHLLATNSQKLGRYRRAVDQYEELIQQNEKDFVALNNLAYLYAEHLSNPDRALELANRAMDLAPEDAVSKANVLDTLGWAQYKAGQVDEAKLTLQQSVRNAPEALPNKLHLAEVLFEKGLDREGEMQLRLLVRLAQKEQDEEMIQRANVLASKYLRKDVR